MTEPYPDCRNPYSVHGCHPAYARRYNGFCLDCVNAGVPEMLEKLLAAEVAAFRNGAAAQRDADIEIVRETYRFAPTHGMIVCHLSNRPLVEPPVG